MLLQLARFVISGGVVTVLGLGVYALVALVLRWNPQLGNFLAYAVAAATGYVMHSRWSFKGHEAEGGMGTQSKFVAVQSIGMAMNAAFTWVITGPFHQATWVPLIPVVLITPPVTFALNRFLVFK